MQKYRALILRSNRFLGSSLVSAGLISSGDLEAANEKFMESIQDPELLRNASILTLLLYDLKVLDEAQLLQHSVDEYGVGLVDLNYIELRSLRPMNIDVSLCWATSTIPFDQVDGTYMLASCYYMSAPVIKYWEEQLGRKVIWYASSMASINRALERIDELHAAERAAVSEAGEPIK